MPNKARAAQGSKDVAALSSVKGAQGRLRQLSSLEGFWKLPPELRQLIIFTACGLPVLPRHIIVGRSFDCTTTMMSLLRSAKSFYATIIPMLYAHVRLSRPSTLRAFQRTLSERPSLGQLVRSLHIGADEPLPETWWPAREAGCGDPDHKVFWLNLGVIDGKGPSWKDSDSYEHELDDYDEEDAQADALDDAFEAAAHDLQVNVRVRSRNGVGEDIGSDEWHVRVLELQAAVEIYYLEMQRCDNRARAKKEKELKRKIEKKKSSTSRISIRPRYPPLRVARSGSSPSGNFGEGDFAITRSQILERMTSAGAPTDSFIHPVLFARSGLSWSAVDYDDKVHSGNNERDLNTAEETADAFSMSYTPSTTAFPGGTVSASSTAGANIDLVSNARLGTATVSGILALARCVLSLTPRVTSLSLTGFLEHVLVGERPSCHQSLHTVSIGPPQVGWEVPLHFANTALDTVKKLRVCGCMLEKKEAASICGDGGALPQLEEFVWSIRGKGDEGEVSEVVDVLKQLVGLDDLSLQEIATGNAPSPSRKRCRLALVHYGGRPDHSSSQHGQMMSLPQDIVRHSTRIEFHTHPDDVKAILQAAPTEELSEAWREGKPSSRMRHCLKVCPQSFDCETEYPAWASIELTKELYEQGREWWENS